MTVTTEPTRRLLDLLRIEEPIVTAPMARIAGGALGRGVHRYAGFVHGLAVRTLVDQQVAEDIAHLPEVRDRDLYVMRPERLPISTAGR